MGFLDNVKAIARVGAAKAGRAATTGAVKGVHLASDVASKGAAQLNKSAGELRDAKAKRTDETGEQPDGGAPR
jgi:hypothetical protein